MQILVTGGAGFIGSHTVDALVEAGHKVVVVDNFNDGYPSQFKRENVKEFAPEVEVVETDISNAELVLNIVSHFRPKHIIHLAARAGVRSSHLDPQSYIHSNINGTANVLEAAKQFGVARCIVASSSSVYGKNQPPFLEDQPLPEPLSLYAATKQATELLAQQYAKQGVPTTLFRFFTVYGERGRPDMAPYIFTKALLTGEPITIIGDGQQLRDFTYVKDIVSGIMAAVAAPTTYPVMNLGHNTPITLMAFLQLLEKLSGKKAQLNFIPARADEMPVTWASISRAEENLGWHPTTSLEQGLTNFLTWYKTHRL